MWCGSRRRVCAVCRVVLVLTAAPCGHGEQEKGILLKTLNPFTCRGHRAHLPVGLPWRMRVRFPPTPAPAAAGAARLLLQLLQRLGCSFVVRQRCMRLS